MAEEDIQREVTRLQAAVSAPTSFASAETVKTKVDAWLELIRSQVPWGRSHRLGATAIADRQLLMCDRAFGDLSSNPFKEVTLPLWREWLDLGSSQWR